MKRILSFITTFIVLQLNAQTTILGGVVFGTWTLAGSPYLIQGGIMIPNDSTLTIQPGVTINFQGQYKLYIQGRLLAMGSIIDSISFTSSDTSVGWLGIRFDSTPINNDTSKIVFCKIQHGKPNGSAGSNNDGGGIYFNNFSKAIVSHSRIYNCMAGTLGYGNGGGICCTGNSTGNSGSCPIIYNNIISNCYAGYDGGGIYCEYNSNPIISFNTIKENSGSGVFCHQASPLILSNKIINNSAANGSGIALEISSNPTISNNTISSNSALNAGGGIWFEDGNPIISKNIIAYNTASDGGGIYSAAYNSCNISNNIISNNIAVRSGGVASYGNAIISNCIIINNKATGSGGTNGGGGIYCITYTTTLINCTIANNDAINGGGIGCNGSNPILKNCILWGNTASTSGSQLFLYDESSDPVFYNCDVEGGTASFGLNGNFYTGTYTNNINSNPQFVSPSGGSGNGFNGVTANWALQSMSPCINAGNPLGTYPTTDIAGNPRIFNSIIDMGAYELQGYAGISQISDLTSQISVYPNPSSGDINITSTNTIDELKVTNMLGQVVYEAKPHTTNTILTLDNAGVYFVTINAGKEASTKKLIVNK